MLSIRFMGAVLTVLAVLAPFQNVLALHAMESAITDAAQDSSITVKGQIGVLNGEGRELVYGGAGAVGSEDYKVSELIWDLKSVLMAGAVVSLGDTGPLTLNAGFWMGVNEGVDGEMYDYDWLDPSRSDWTDRSRSEVDVVDAMMFDANLAFKVIEGEDYSLGVVGGLMYEVWEWDDRGQEFTYSVCGFRDTTGSFDGANVIDYKQTFLIPYIGVEAAADMGSLSLQGYLTYTVLVAAWDEDHHILRDLHFEENFTGGEFFAVGASATFEVGEAMFVQGSFDYEQVDEIRGDLEIVETGTTVEDGAGISYEATTVSISVGIRL